MRRRAEGGGVGRSADGARRSLQEWERLEWGGSECGRRAEECRGGRRPCPSPPAPIPLSPPFALLPSPSPSRLLPIRVVDPLPNPLPL